MKQTKITVGIPCYNAESTIGLAVESALAQEWANIEVLVVDDCSTDRSCQIVESIEVQDSRVQLIRHKKNTGPGGVRSTIVAKASGEFIAFFDDDDESHPSRLRSQFERIVEYEEQTDQRLIACYAGGSRRYPNGYTRRLQAIGSRPRIPQGKETAIYLLFNERAPNVFYGSGTPTSALMARKSIIETVGGFDKEFRRVEDIDFAIRLALKGGHFIGCAENLYTQAATTGSDKTAETNFQAELQLVEKFKDFLVSKNRYLYAKCWFRFRFYHFNGENLKAFFTLVRCWLSNPLVVTRHFLRSAPRRFIHELRMGRFGKQE